MISAQAQIIGYDEVHSIRGSSFFTNLNLKLSFLKKNSSRGVTTQGNHKGFEVFVFFFKKRKPRMPLQHFSLKFFEEKL